MLRPRDASFIPAWDFARLERAPWLAALKDVVHLYRDCKAWPSTAEHNHVLQPLQLVNAWGTPLRFENAATRRTRRKAPSVVDLAATYDGQVAHRGIVPTRDSVPHDFFNAISWAAFPKTKRAINRLQIEALTRRIGVDAQRVPNARSREEDLLTMLDEGGLIDAHRPYVLGHALMEHFYTSDVAVRAFAVPIANAGERRDVDDALALLLQKDASALDPSGAKGRLVSASFESV